MQIESILRNKKVKILLLPLFGFFIFILFYIIAAYKYPGGSWAFPNHDSFSFWNNYLCDLLDTYAINGKLNVARHYARVSLGFLSASIILIWLYLPNLFEAKSFNLSMMRVTGILSLVIIMFLASGTHDLIVRIAGIFGTTALITSFFEFYKARFYKILFLGLFSFLIFILNYYIYETGWNIKYLPIIQKITFSSFIVWLTSLDILLIKYLRTLSNDII